MVVTESPEEIAARIQEAVNPAVAEALRSPSYAKLSNGYNAFIALWKELEASNVLVSFVNGKLCTNMPEVLEQLNIHTMKGFRP